MSKLLGVASQRWQRIENRVIRKKNKSKIEEKRETDGRWRKGLKIRKSRDLSVCVCQSMSSLQRCRTIHLNPAGDWRWSSCSCLSNSILFLRRLQYFSSSVLQFFNSIETPWSAICVSTCVLQSSLVQSSLLVALLVIAAERVCTVRRVLSARQKERHIQSPLVDRNHQLLLLLLMLLLLYSKKEE